MPRVTWLCALFCAFTLQTFAAGVTVVTHGFSGNADGWVAELCRRIPLHPRSEGTNVTIYRVGISSDSTVTRALIQGVSPGLSDSGEIIIALDWSVIAGLFQASTTDIANKTAGFLLSTNFIPELDGRALAEFPLHLVGHSRGASAMAETARVLGAQGVWVDHLTLLDPYPLTLNGDPAQVSIYANVFFAENFRQADGFPTGQVVPGTYDRLLTTLGVGGFIGSSAEHSDVHLWYRCTIDLSPVVLVEGGIVGAAERAVWWTPAEQFGTNAGFIYSLIGKGDRFLTSNPGGTTGAISDGVNKRWNLGAGLAANRAALPSNNGTWPNLIRMTLHQERTGGAAVQVFYQHGANVANIAALTLCLDADRNPLNSNHVDLVTQPLNGTGPAQVQSLATRLPDPVSMKPGFYALFGKMNLGSRTRYLYAQEHFVVPPRLESPRATAEGFDFTLQTIAGTTTTIQGSIDLETWVDVGISVTNTSTEQISIPLESPYRFFRAVSR